MGYCQRRRRRRRRSPPMRPREAAGGQAIEASRNIISLKASILLRMEAPLSFL